MGRFINADGIIGETGELLSHNIFAYCNNNFANFNAPSGYLRCALDYEGSGSYIGNVSTTSKPVVENLKNVGKMVAINTINGGMDKVVSTVTATVLIPLVWDL